MLYAASPENWRGGWGTRPPLSEFSGSAPGKGHKDLTRFPRNNP